MTPELIVLVLAALLQCVQFVSFAIPANIQIGSAYLMSARDRPPSRDLDERTARLKRAFDNHFEGLILFGIAAVVIAVTGQSSGLTGFFAWVYLIARVVYVPAYALGWNPGRTLIWAAGFLSTVALLVLALI
ncbi:MAPEG family protein [Oceaniovalibus guishaninsula]|nr:MAPEG family protein [Oceaniovalibus guishaninsula]